MTPPGISLGTHVWNQHPTDTSEFTISSGNIGFLFLGAVELVTLPSSFDGLLGSTRASPGNSLRESSREVPWGHPCPPLHQISLGTHVWNQHPTNTFEFTISLGNIVFLFFWEPSSS